jgi:hypothetical protein
MWSGLRRGLQRNRGNVYEAELANRRVGVKHVTVPLPTEAPEVEPSPAAVAVAVAVEQATLAAARDGDQPEITAFESRLAASIAATRSWARRINCAHSMNWNSKHCPKPTERSN